MAALASWLAADGDGTTEKNDQIQARAAQAAGPADLSVNKARLKDFGRSG